MYFVISLVQAYFDEAVVSLKSGLWRLCWTSR